jgi:ketosteroid isomerase-like protein
VTEDEARVREILADVAEGYRTKDADRIVGHNAPDIVVFNLAPPLVQRRGDSAESGGGRRLDLTTAAGVTAWLAGFGDSPCDYEVKALQVTASGDVAFAHGLARMGSAAEFSLWFRMTVGLRRSPGRWRITHIHPSVPFYMDQTGRAALDLRP